ncbi:MAG: hypothetical protein JWP09_158 [Candidatus Taylorbacteria bacterium]|nr:hypothetical protein [Candidatus Taylorbacteria bacterium]
MVKVKDIMCEECGVVMELHPESKLMKCGRCRRVLALDEEDLDDLKE